MADRHNDHGTPSKFQPLVKGQHSPKSQKGITMSFTNDEVKESSYGYV